jgi:hypothetical protein
MRLLKKVLGVQYDKNGKRKILATEYPSPPCENTRVVLVEKSIEIEVEILNDGLRLKYHDHECILPKLACDPGKIQNTINLAIRRDWFSKIPV